MQIIKEETRAKLNEILDRGLCAGLGAKNGPVCLEAAITIACGEPFGAAPTCVHPTVRAHSIALNDCTHWGTPKVRADSLRAYALNQLGCTQIDGGEFAKRLAIENARQVLPICLRALAALPFFSAEIKAGLLESVELCEAATTLAQARAAANSARLAARLAAESAAWSAASAARSAASAAESARSAADSADSAESARSAAESAWSAADSAAGSEDTILILAAKIANEILSDLLKG